FQRPVRTQNHADSFELARALRAVVDEHDAPPRFVVGEVFGPTARIRDYCRAGLHLVFAFKTLRTPFDAPSFRALLVELEEAFAEPLLPAWAFGNHDRARSIGRLDGDPARAKLLAAFQLTVRGVPFIYYGEELGLPGDEGLPFAGAQDPLARRYRFVP